MPLQSWEANSNTIFNGAAQTGDGTALANSAAETIISQTAPDITFAPNYLQPGKLLRVTAYGRYSTTGTPTLELRLRWGGVAGVLLLDTTAITSISGAANTAFKFECLMQVRSIGSSGTMFSQGQAFGLTATTSVALLPATGPASATIDTTASKALVLTATWGTASASNTITLSSFAVEELN